MSQQRIGIGLAALAVIGLVAGAAFFLLQAAEPEPVPQPVKTPTRQLPPPVERPKAPEVSNPTGGVKPITQEVFNPAFDPRTARDQLALGGSVVDAANNGIPNAKVELVFDQSAVIARAQEADVRGSFQTLADGKFYFSQETCPACGLSFNERYVLRISHPDFAVERLSGVDLRDPRWADRTIVLSPGANRLVGSVRDSSGAPVAAAEVRVYDLNVSTTDPDGSIERSGLSGADGAFVVANLKPGLKKLWCVRSGYASAGRPTFTLDAARPDAAVDFVLRPGQSIAGVIVAQETGLGIPNAYVTLKPTRFGPAATVPKQAEVEDMKRRIAEGEDPALLKEAMQKASGAKDGVAGAERARAEALRAKAEREQARREGRKSDEGSDDGSGDVDSADPVDPRENAAALRRSQELAQAQQNMQLTTVSFRTDPDGKFKADGLDEGAYQITVAAPGYAPPPIQSAETGNTAVSFSLQSNARIVGRCIDDETGAPLTAFVIGLGTSFDQNSVPYHMRKSFGPPKTVDGAFEYVDVRAGTYFLVAEAPGYAGGRSEQLVIGQSERREGIVIRLVKGATVLGRVIDAAGKPVADAVVSIDAAAMSDPNNIFGRLFATQLRRELKEARTTAEGTYRIPNVLDGKYALKVRHPDFGPFDDPNPFDVPKSGEVSRPDVNLSRGGTIRGVILRKDGSPDNQAMVTVTPVTAGGFNQRQAQTDSDGRFEISGLAAGEYRVVCAQKEGKVELGPLLGIALQNQQRGGAVPVGTPAPGMPPMKVVMLTEGAVIEINDL